MITLPVTAQMYHSLVQQQISGSDNTVCVTPMQVPSLFTNNHLCSLVSNFGTTTTTLQIVSNKRNATNNNLNPDFAPVVKKHILKKNIMSITAKNSKLNSLKIVKTTNMVNASDITNSNSIVIKNKSNQKNSKYTRSVRLKPKNRIKS